MDRCFVAELNGDPAGAAARPLPPHEIEALIGRKGLSPAGVRA